MKSKFLIVILLTVALCSIGFKIYAQSSRPVWTGKNCGRYYNILSSIPGCVRDTLNQLSPEVAVEAKVVTFVSGSEGASSDVFVFYPNK